MCFCHLKTHEHKQNYNKTPWTWLKSNTYRDEIITSRVHSETCFLCYTSKLINLYFVNVIVVFVKIPSFHRRAWVKTAHPEKIAEWSFTAMSMPYLK